MFKKFKFLFKKMFPYYIEQSSDTFRKQPPGEIDFSRLMQGREKVFRYSHGSTQKAQKKTIIITDWSLQYNAKFRNYVFWMVEIFLGLKYPVYVWQNRNTMMQIVTINNLFDKINNIIPVKHDHVRKKAAARNLSNKQIDVFDYFRVRNICKQMDDDLLAAGFKINHLEKHKPEKKNWFHFDDPYKVSRNKFLNIINSIDTSLKINIYIQFTYSSLYDKLNIFLNKFKIESATVRLDPTACQSSGTLKLYQQVINLLISKKIRTNVIYKTSRMNHCSHEINSKLNLLEFIDQHQKHPINNCLDSVSCSFRELPEIVNYKKLKSMYYNPPENKSLDMLNKILFRLETNSLVTACKFEKIKHLRLSDDVVGFEKLKTPGFTKSIDCKHPTYEYGEHFSKERVQLIVDLSSHCNNLKKISAHMDIQKPSDIALYTPLFNLNIPNLDLHITFYSHNYNKIQKLIFDAINIAKELILEILLRSSDKHYRAPSIFQNYFNKNKQLSNISHFKYNGDSTITQDQCLSREELRYLFHVCKKLKTLRIQDYELKYDISNERLSLPQMYYLRKINLHYTTLQVLTDIVKVCPNLCDLSFHSYKEDIIEESLRQTLPYLKKLQKLTIYKTQISSNITKKLLLQLKQLRYIKLPLDNNVLKMLRASFPNMVIETTKFFQSPYQYNNIIFNNKLPVNIKSIGVDSDISCPKTPTNVQAYFTNPANNKVIHPANYREEMFSPFITKNRLFYLVDCRSFFSQKLRLIDSSMYSHKIIANAPGCRLGIIPVAVSKDPISLPNINPDDKIIALACDLPFLNLKLYYDDIGNLYYIVADVNSPITINIEIQLECKSYSYDFIEYSDAKNWSVDTLKEKLSSTKDPYEVISLLRAYFRSFPTQQPGYLKKLPEITPQSTSNEILNTVIAKKEGACRHRAKAFLYFLETIINPKLNKNNNKSILARLVSNQCHQYVEVLMLVSNNWKWIKVDLGGYAANINLLTVTRAAKPKNDDSVPHFTTLQEQIEQTIHPAFMSWKQKGNNPKKTAPSAIVNNINNYRGKNILVEFIDPAQIIKFKAELLQQLNKNNILWHCIHVNELDETIAIQNLVEVLKEATSNKSLLIVNASRMKGDKIGELHNLLDYRKLQSSNLTTNLPIVLLSPKRNHLNADSSFSSRFHHELIPLINENIDIYNGRLKSASNNQTFKINLSCSGAYKLKLEAKYNCKGEIKPRIFIKAIDSKINHITIINRPKKTPKSTEFEEYISEILHGRAIFVEKKPYKLPPKIYISFTENPCKLSFITILNNKLFEYIILNPVTCYNFFKIHYTKNQQYYLAPGWIPQYANKILTCLMPCHFDEISINNKYKLEKYAIKYNCVLKIMQKEKPYPFSTQSLKKLINDVGSAVVIKTNNLAISKHDIMQKIKIDYCITTSKYTESADILSRYNRGSGKNKLQLDIITCNVLDELKNGKTVLLIGSFSKELLYSLEPLLYNSFILVNNEEIFNKGRLIIVAKDKIDAPNKLLHKYEIKNIMSSPINVEDSYTSKSGKVIETLKSSSIVLITGPTACGKSLFAQDFKRKNTNIIFFDGIEKLTDFCKCKKECRLVVDNFHLLSLNDKAKLSNINKQEVIFIIKGQIYTLRPDQKIIIISSLDHEETLKMLPCIDKDIPGIIFSEPSAATLKNKVEIILSAYNDDKDFNEKKSEITKKLLKYYHVIKDSCPHVTSRQLEDLVLYFIYYYKTFKQLKKDVRWCAQHAAYVVYSGMQKNIKNKPNKAKNSSSKKRKYEKMSKIYSMLAPKNPQLVDYILTDPRKKQLRKLIEYCNVMKLKQELNLASFGTKAIAFTGPSGVGKTSLFKEYFEIIKCNFIYANASNVGFLKNKILSTDSETYVIIDEYNVKNISSTLKQILCLPHLRIILLGNTIDFCDRELLELDIRNQFMTINFKTYSQEELYQYAKTKGLSKEKAKNYVGEYCKAHNYAKKNGHEPPNFRVFKNVIENMLQNRNQQ